MVGFYSLVVGALAPKTIPLLKRTYGNRGIPVVYLAALAVNTADSEQGIGTALMFDAFKKAASIADVAGVGCMSLDAVNEDRASWYARNLQFERFGFTPDGKVQMYIPMATILDALS